MNKIPVFATIGHAYGFATSRFLNILGIVWAPLVASMAVGLMLTPGFAGNHIPIDDADAIRRNAAHFAPFVFAFSLFIRAMIGVGVTELALDKRSGITFVYFSLGARVWRLIGAWLLFILVMILIYIGLIVLTVVVAFGGGLAVKSLALSQGANAVAVGVLVLVCFLLFFGSLVYVLARLTFLIPPVVVNENKIDLARGWELTKGSFWRIFWIGFAIFVPLILAQGILLVSFYGTGIFLQFFDIMHAGMLRQINEAVMQSRIDQWSAMLRTQGLRTWPYTAAIGLAIETFACGLLYGAAAFGYRAVTQAPASAPDLR
ncbi:MAG: hypothetical protein ACTHLR_09585 [Rhizomicrobium sp.]